MMHIEGKYTKPRSGETAYFVFSPAHNPVFAEDMEKMPNKEFIQALKIAQQLVTKWNRDYATSTSASNYRLVFVGRVRLTFAKWRTAGHAKRSELGDTFRGETREHAKERFLAEILSDNVDPYYSECTNGLEYFRKGEFQDDGKPDCLDEYEPPPIPLLRESPKESSRKTFERWALSRGNDITYFMNDPDGDFYDDTTQAMWEAWQKAKSGESKWH